MKSILISFFAVQLMVGINTLYAQQNDTFREVEVLVDLPVGEDSLAEATVQETYFIIDALDSLTNCLYSGCYKYNDSLFIQQRFAFDTVSFPDYSDSIIISNMAHMPVVIPLAYNPYVKAYIDLYTLRKRDQVKRMLGMAELYFPIFEEALDRRNMPIELKYLPVIESALNPNAVSKMGATGLWQIMYSTGKWLNLDIHSYLDERRDPYKSTEAAVEYLNRMYDVYGDWLMVIAAYNCGPGNVNKAIKRSGGKKTFWEIRPYLPVETRGYVPAFIGAMYVLHHFEDYKFTPIHTGFSFNQTDTVMVYRQVTLARIADVLGMDQLELEFLNPALRKGEVPASRNGYALKLPITRIAAFEDYRDSIFLGPIATDAIAGTNTDNANSTVSTTTSTTNNSSSANSTSYDDGTTTKVSYTVKKGDNLGYISEWFDCSVSEIKKWNGMSSTVVHVGQKLKVYVPSYRAEQYRKVEYLTLTQKNRKEHLKTTPIAPKTNNTASTSTIGTKNDSGDVKYTAPSTNELTLITYVVKSGDYLSVIASWYNCSVSEVKNWNDLATNSLNAGQRLNIYVPTAKLSQYQAINGMSTADKAKLGNGSGSTNSTPSSKVVYHTVRSGDTLWEIAQKYPGVTVKQIMNQNGLTEGQSLKVGMKLKIQM
jgi:membrane-bound lytic murein transglycosylase D